MLRRSWDQVGGPNAITFWAWLVTLPISVLISSTYTTTPTLDEFLSWTTALILVHVGVGAVMLIARLTVLPSRPRRSRPITAIVVFGLLGLTRAVLLQVAQEAVGFGIVGLPERLAFNISTMILVFAALAIIVGETKDDAQIFLRLTSATDSLAELRQRNEEDLLALDRSILTDVQDRLQRELREHPTDPAHLRELSETVVRSMSHDLAGPAEQLQVPRPSRIQALRDIGQRLEVPPPLAVLIPLQLAVFGFVAVRYTLLLALFDTLVGPLPSLAGLWLLRKYMPLPRRIWLRVTVLIVTITAVGSVASMMVTALIKALFGSFEVSDIAVGFGLMALSMIVSVWIAVVDGRKERQAAMVRAIESEARESARVQAVIDERRQRAARFLHGTVQNELIAASLRGDSTAEVQSSVKALFASYADERPRTQCRSDLEALLGSWSQVLSLNVSLDPAVWDAIQGDKARGDALMDVVAEGLTNAVRHSASREVGVTVSVDSGDIDVRISTVGNLTDNSTPGIGLADLRSRGVEADLLGENSRTTLIARIPQRLT